MSAESKLSRQQRRRKAKRRAKNLWRLAHMADLLRERRYKYGNPRQVEEP